MNNGVEIFLAAAGRDADDPESRMISDQELEQVLTAGVQLYARRTEATGLFPAPLSRAGVTATDVLTAVSEMIRVVDVNMFDLSMWFRRPR